MSSQDEDYVYEVRVQTPSCMAFIPDRWNKVSSLDVVIPVDKRHTEPLNDCIVYDQT